MKMPGTEPFLSRKQRRQIHSTVFLLLVVAVLISWVAADIPGDNGLQRGRPVWESGLP